MQELHAALADWTLQKQWSIENTISKQRTVVMEGAGAMRPPDGWSGNTCRAQSLYCANRPRPAP